MSCGVPPKQFMRGEWFVAVALLTGIVWVLCYTGGLATWAYRPQGCTPVLMATGHQMPGDWPLGRTSTGGVAV